MKQFGCVYLGRNSGFGLWGICEGFTIMGADADGINIQQYQQYYLLAICYYIIPSWIKGHIIIHCSKMVRNGPHPIQVLLVVATLCFLGRGSPECIAYLQKLHNQSILNPAEFLHNMTPYLILSGKSIDDLGFPGSCGKDQNKYAYSTVEVTISTNTTDYTGYLGFCFVSMCGVDDLNQFAEFIVDFIFQEYKDGVSGKFVDPPLELTFSPGALVLSLVFLAIVVISMLDPIRSWLRMCKSPQNSDYQIKSLYIDLQNPHIELDQERITQESTLLQRISLRYKWKQLWQQETNYNIFSFSLFRICAVPVLLYGEIFWFTNFGAYNYYAFYEEIYQQLYVKFALFGYYMPDIFIFISGFLFTRKILAIEDNHIVNIFKSVGWKLLRLYPLYIVVLVIYWGISPALHAGPIWYIYQEQAAVCNTAWWRVLLMIDNWFASGCYPVLWFVQVQVQYVLFCSVLFFTIYTVNKKVGLYIFAAYFITALVLLFVFSGEMLVSVQIAIDPYTELYYKSFYSHIWFYLCGVLFAILAEKESVRMSMQMYILDKPILNNFLRLFSVGILVLILLRPWTWSGQTPLSLQLTFCRIGTLFSFIILFLNGMFVRETSTTVIHKYAYYMYPVILISYLIASSSFWSVDSFMYVSGYDVLNQMIPNFIISYSVGIGLGLLFDWRTLVTK